MIIEFGGHSVGVIPGLVSIPEVKSLRVWFVYYGFRSMGISFCCQPFFYLKFFSFIINELFLFYFVKFGIFYQTFSKFFSLLFFIIFSDLRFIFFRFVIPIFLDFYHIVVYQTFIIDD